MRASIENLSQLVPMTELFTDAGVKTRPLQDNTAQPRFKDVLSEARIGGKPERAEKTTGKEGEEPVEPEKAEKDEEKAEVDETSIPGLVNQNRVVFILEGEKDENSSELRIDSADMTVTADAEHISVTDGQEELPEAPVTDENKPVADGTTTSNVKTEEETETKSASEAMYKPEIKSADDIKTDMNVKPEAEPVEKPAQDAMPIEPEAKTVINAEPKVDRAVTTETEPKAETAVAVSAENATEKATTPQTANAEDAQAAPETAQEIEKTAESAAETSPDTEAAAEPEAKSVITASDEKTDAESDIGNGDGEEDAIGKAMARTPSTRTAERSDTEKRENGYSENSDLCPLENENDEPRVKGQKDKESAEAEEVRDTKKDTAVKPALNTAEQNAADIRPEKLQSGQQMSEALRTAQNTPVAKENMFDAMVERIDMMKTADMRQMSIKLNPEFLGDLSLRITMNADGLHVKIGAGNREVSSMINNQINSLIESLSSKGVEVAKVEVVYTGVESNAYNDQQERRQDQPGQSRRSGGRRTDSTAFYAVSALEEMTGYLDIGVSSVEYRA